MPDLTIQRLGQPNTSGLFPPGTTFAEGARTLGVAAEGTISVNGMPKQWTDVIERDSVLLVSQNMKAA